ncbi:MAG: NADH-quinone oxidoreductase subunit J [Geobacter sp.]|nr:NADH-quinone oxidoreductase subunit J [Geobacter sp.]
MNLYQILFYLLAFVMVAATIFAITEKHPVHAIVYLVTSFFALAAIFYLLAAPLVAMFEVIIYAGAIMVLFMFVIMMLHPGSGKEALRPGLRHWLPAILFAAVILVSLTVTTKLHLAAASAAVTGLGVKELSIMLFTRYGTAVEIISMQLLFAVVGALYLGKRRKP